MKALGKRANELFFSIFKQFATEILGFGGLFSGVRAMPDWLLNTRFRGRLDAALLTSGEVAKQMRGLIYEGLWVVAGLTLVILAVWALVQYKTRPADPAEWQKAVRKTRWFMGIIVSLQTTAVGLLVGLSSVFNETATIWASWLGFVFFLCLAALATWLGSSAIFRAAINLR